jgi:hypothetical protein
MIYEVVLTEEVERDVDEVILWYEEQQTGLGLRFYSCLLERLEKVKINPQYYFNIQEGYRRIIIDPFPYSIIY